MTLTTSIADQVRELSFRCNRCGAPVPLGSETDQAAPQCPSCGEQYPCDGGIVVLGDNANEGDYPEEAFDYIARVEPKHFWFEARNKMILSCLNASVGPLPGRSALDLGCGTGFVLAALEGAGMRTCGIDMHLAGLRYARQRTSGHLLRSGSGQNPFEAQFDAVLLCDVIEHVDDDVGLLRQATQALGDGGKLLVTVPALPQLWTAMDDVSGHKRRYTKASLQTALGQAGVRPVMIRYFGGFILPMQLLQRLIAGRGGAASSQQILERGLAAPMAPFNRLLGALMTVDRRLSRLRLPFGGSLIAIGEREG